MLFSEASYFNGESLIPVIGSIFDLTAIIVAIPILLIGIVSGSFLYVAGIQWEPTSLLVTFVSGALAALTPGNTEHMKMANDAVFFDHYKLQYQSGDTDGCDAIVVCYERYRSSSGEYDYKRVGFVKFYNDSHSLPDNRWSGDKPVINYRLDRFSDVMLILQNESPLYLKLAENGLGYIATDKHEPIGDSDS